MATSEWSSLFGRGARIGNYIYLRAANYKKYGLNHPDRQIKERDAGQVFQDMHDSLKANIKNSKVKDDAIERIQRLYNFMYGQDSLSQTDNGREVVEAAQQDLLKIINDSAINIDWEKAQATSYKKGFKGAFGENWTSVEKLESIYNKILNIRDQLNSKSRAAKSYTNAAAQLGIDLDNKMRELDSLVQTIINKENTQENSKELFDLLKSKGNKLNNYTRLYFNDALIISLVDVIRELAIFTEATSSTKAMGILGEDSVLAVHKQILALGDKEVQKLVDNMFINKGGSAIKAPHVIRSGSIIGGNTEENLKDGYIKRLGANEIKLNSVEQKVDIEFIIDDQEIGTSIKNYSPDTVSEYGIGILSGKNLLTYLQNNVAFANHYLNLSSTHEDGENDIDSNLLQQAHELLKLQLGVIALVGGLPYLDKATNQIKEEKKAELFIINRQKGGRANFEIYRTTDLIERLIENSSLIDIKRYNNIWDNKREPPDTPSISSAYARCLKVLTQLRHFDINVRLKENILD